MDLTNLQRQILYATADVGTPKVAAAKARLAAVNPDVRIETIAARVGAGELAPLVERADVVLDCSDNFATRHAVNRACVAARTPLVSGAAIRFDGQIAVFDPRVPDAPCYHCLFGEGEDLEATRCAVMGVFAPVVGIVGATQAAEALKLIAGIGEPLAGRLLLLDAFAMRWREVRVPRDPHCPVCGAAMMRATMTRAFAVALAATAARGSARRRRRPPRRPSADAALADAEWLAIKATISEQLAALKAGDGAKAFAHAAPAIRQQFGTATDFLAMVRTAYGALIAARYSEFLEGAVIEGSVIQPLRLVAPDNSVRVALYTMQKQPDGRWKISGCVLAPSTVQAA